MWADSRRDVIRQWYTCVCWLIWRKNADTHTTTHPLSTEWSLKIKFVNPFGCLLWFIIKCDLKWSFLRLNYSQPPLYIFCSFLWELQNSEEELWNILPYEAVSVQQDFWDVLRSQRLSWVNISNLILPLQNVHFQLHRGQTSQPLQEKGLLPWSCPLKIF